MDKVQFNAHKRAVIYARVSSDDRGKDGRNLQSQIEMGRKYALEREYRIVAELPEDDRGASGASFELPQLSNILSMADYGTFDVLVIREIDRLSRNLAKQLIVEDMLKRAGVDIEYVLGEYPDTAEGRLQKHIRATIAEFEREKINERMTRGRLNVVRRGEVMFHGDRPPYGYRLSSDGKALIIHEREAATVRMMFEWYTIGDENGRRLSIKAIAERLSALRVPTWRDIRGLNKQRDRGQWHQATVSQMLHNETYVGVWRYGKRRDRGAKSTDRELIAVPVPAIITPEVWEATQKQFKANQVKQKHEKVGRYLMTSRLTCKCGYSIMAFTTRRKGHEYSYYFCNSAHRDLVRGYCGLAYLRADQVDMLIWLWLREWLLNPDELNAKLDAYLDEQARANAPLFAQLKTTEELIRENQVQLGRLLDLYLAGRFDGDMLEDRKLRLEGTIAKLQSERERIESILHQEVSRETITEITEFVVRLSKGLEMADQSFEARRRIINQLDVRGVVADEDGERVIYPSFILSPAGDARLRVLGNGSKVGDASIA